MGGCFNEVKCNRRIAIVFPGILFSNSLQRSQDFERGHRHHRMGWNSWDFGPTVTEEEVKANADYMASHLKQFGWEYIVVDIRWYVANDKSHGYNEKGRGCRDGWIRAGFFQPSTGLPSSAEGKGFKTSR